MEKAEIGDHSYLDRLLKVVQWLSDKLGSRERLAILLMSIANLMWPLSFLYINEHNVSPLHTSLARGVAIVFTHWPICKMLGIDLDVKSTFEFRLLFQRNIIIVLHQFYYFALHFVLSLPTINTILLSCPLFAFILDYFMNGVTVTRQQFISIAVGIFGVAMTVNADLLMALIDSTYTPKSDFQNYMTTDPIIKIVLSGGAILFNVGWAYATVKQKKISHIPGIKISYKLGIDFILMAGFALCLRPTDSIKVEYFLGATVFSGALMGICQILFLSALNLSKNTGILTMLMLINTVSAYFVSFFRYNEPINALAIMGLTLMGCGLGTTIMAKKK